MTNFRINPHHAPMPLTKEMRLKIFGLVSVREEMKKALLPNDVWLTIAAGYELAGAILAANAGIERAGLKPEDFDVAYIHNVEDVEGLLGWVPAPAQKIKVEEEVLTPVAIRTPAKSARELVSYLKFVADIAATAEEKKVLEKVGEKFLLKYAEVKK